MQNEYNKQILADGISFYGITDSKFKHNRVSIYLTIPLQESTVSANALLPFIMRRGCKGFEDFSKLNRELDELYGAALVSDVAKIGANQILTYSIQSIDNRFTLDNEDILKRSAELLCNVVLSPVVKGNAFLEEDLEIEKQNLIDTVLSEINDKRGYAISQLRQLMDKGRPIAIKKYGKVEDIEAITPKSAYEAYKNAIATADIRMITVGKGDNNIALEVFKKHFGNLGRKTNTPIPPTYYPVASPINEQNEKLDVVQCKLALGFRVPEQKTEQDIMAAKLMNILYGATVSSKLFVNVREKLSLCYYCASRYDHLNGTMFVDSGVEVDKVEMAKAEILKQFDDVKNGIISDDEINSAKLAIKNSLRAVTDSLSGIENWHLTASLTNRERMPKDDFAVIDSIDKEMIAKIANTVELDSIYLLSPINEGENA